MLNDPVSIGGGNRINATLGHAVTDVASEPSTYTFQYNGTGLRNAVVLLVLRGVDLANPIVGTLSANPTDGFAAPTGSLILAQVANELTAGNSNTPTVTDPDYSTLTVQGSATGTSGTRTAVWVGTATAAADFAPSAGDTTWSANAARTFWYVAIQGAYS